MRSIVRSTVLHLFRLGLCTQYTVVQACWELTLARYIVGFAGEWLCITYYYMLGRWVFGVLPDAGVDTL